MSHRIETLTWEAVFSHVRLAHTQQDRLSQFIHQHALPCLRARFDAISPGHEVWTLDRLEINIGKLNAEDSPSQWLRQFDTALQYSLARLTAPAPTALPVQKQVLHEGVAGPPFKRQSAALHDMGQFLHYLQQGVLPWGMPLRSARDMAGWLERLARLHGLRLWQTLQQLMPPEPVLARLARIAPHTGLQALLEVRHRDLADGLLLLDDAWLRPLQTRGRLSAYQVQSLQQRLRVAGLRTLWGLSGGVLGGARQHGLLLALRDAHAQLIGPGWRSLRQSLQGQALPRQPSSELGAAMLQALLAHDVLADAPDISAVGNSASHQFVATPLSERSGTSALPQPSPLPAVRLRQLHTQVQAWADGYHTSASTAQISAWFIQWQQHAPAALVQSLRQHLRQRRSRRAWSLALPLSQQWSLLALLADATGRLNSTAVLARHDSKTSIPQRATTSHSVRQAPPQWADSLRQTALQFIQQASAGSRLGLSAMQALLMEASLAHLLLHGRLPHTHTAWQAVWTLAWQTHKPGRVQGQKSGHAQTSKRRQKIGPVNHAEQNPLNTSVSASTAPDPSQADHPPNWHQLPWLASLIARWQPSPLSENQDLATQPCDPGSALRALPNWPAAALRSWLWRQTEDYVQQQAGPLHPAPLQAQWQSAWQNLQSNAWAAAVTSTATHVHATAQPKATTWQLHALWLQCEQGAWGPTQQRALAQLLEQRQVCALWCVHFDEEQRWRWLQAQFGPVGQTLRQCADDLWQHWLKLAQAHTPAVLARAQTGLERSRSLSISTMRKRHWALLCEHLFVLGGPARPEALRQHYHAALQKLLPAGALACAPVEMPAQMLAPIHEKVSEQISALGPVPRWTSASVSATVHQARHAPSSRRAAAVPRPLAPNEHAMPVPIWIEDAGQVLLTAYAERLFKHLGLVESGRFVDAQAQARGVLCLQALVQGDTATCEAMWPLSKLLCGASPSDILPTCEPLGESELALFNDLLQAVVAHWQAIGHTSVAGLRESFLQREGCLERQRATDGSPPPWRLKVQPRAFDMLLDRLPWGFSTIKLPWMQTVLYVDWR